MDVHPKHTGKSQVTFVFRDVNELDSYCRNLQTLLYQTSASLINVKVNSKKKFKIPEHIWTSKA